MNYSLDDGDGASFEIDSTGQVKMKDALDHETKSSYTITVSVSDRKDDSGNCEVTPAAYDTHAVTIIVTDSDDDRKGLAPGRPSLRLWQTRTVSYPWRLGYGRVHRTKAIGLPLPMPRPTTTPLTQMTSANTCALRPPMRRIWRRQNCKGGTDRATNQPPAGIFRRNGHPLRSRKHPRRPEHL